MQQPEPEPIKGIHENNNCTRCGACCVYFRVKYDDNEVFKKSGEICPYLSYNLETRTAACAIHDLDIRPSMCKDFTCWEFRLEFIVGNSKHWYGLKETSENMPVIINAYSKTLDIITS
jgi:Fe-S-cluster containining protein